MASYRKVDVIYCDDIRHEVGNKLSFMGVYTGELLVPGFPATLAKLCMYISVSTPKENPFQRLTLKVLRDSEVLTESEIPNQDLAEGQSRLLATEDPEAEEPRFAMNVELVAAQLAFAGPAKIRVRIVTESEELKGRALRVMQMPTTT
jgi:hypothetical protein